MLGLRTRTWVIGGVIAALVGTAAVAGRYHHRGHSPEDRADWASYMVTKRLELNGEQQAAFEKIAQSYVELMGTRRSFMSERTFSTAWITVVWSRPPNSRAMAG